MKLSRSEDLRVAAVGPCQSEIMYESGLFDENEV